MSQPFRASMQPGLEVYYDESNNNGKDINNIAKHNHNNSISSHTANLNQQCHTITTSYPPQSHPSSPNHYNPNSLDLDQCSPNVQWDAKQGADMEVNYSSPVKGYPPHQYSYGDGEAGGKRRILGLTVGVFWAVIALSFLLLAGAIGGGIGGGLASQKNSSTSTQSSPIIQSISTPVISTPTSSGSAQATSVAPLSTAFPAAMSACDTSLDNNGTLLTAASQSGASYGVGSDDSFQLLCNTNYPAGAAYGNPDTFDLMHALTATMEDCITLCGTWNTVINGSSTLRCAAVALVKKPGEFCYLKSDIAGATNDSSTSGVGVKIDSAILLQTD